jgi:hypothetical protein
MSIDMKIYRRIDSRKNISSGADGAAIRDVSRKLTYLELQNARLKKAGIRITVFIARP